MDLRERRFNSVPVKEYKYTRKSDITDRRSFPPCPPMPSKSSKRRSLFQERHVARVIFFIKPVALSRLYSPDKESSYFDQIFAKISTTGEGSFGVVFKVRSKEDDKLYAIKQFKTTHNTRYGYAEVENYEKIGEHINFVKFIMAWEEHRTVHIQMEYCDISLAQYATAAQKITESQLWEILHDMLEALNCLHSKNLIHLDVKPGNIMMSHGIYKLADFGLLVDLNNHDGRKISTISDGDAKYLACEVLDGIYTYSCDIFGLGISLLELATNIELPEFGPLWHQIRKEYLPTSFYKGVTKSFALTIEKMMAPIHWERPQASQLLKTRQLKRVQKRDMDTPRNNFCPELVDEAFSYRACKLVENNNIIETPKRPLYEVHKDLSHSNSHFRDLCMEMPTDSTESLVLEERSSPNGSNNRRSLCRIKLTF